jgi:conjugative transfer region protein TrbK
MDDRILARTLIVAALAVLLVTAIGILHRSDGVGQSNQVVSSAVRLDDLSAELKRCSKLEPQDAVEDSRCQAVWEENRRRFFGQPPRPLAIGPDKSAHSMSGSDSPPSTVSPRASASPPSVTGAPQP